MASHGKLPDVPEDWSGRYRLVETPKWRAWIDRAWCFDSLEDYLDRPDRFFEEEVVEWYKRGRNLLAEVRWPLAATENEAPKTVVLKKFGSPGSRGALRAYWRPGRSLRAWKGAFTLLERGFSTPRPLWLAVPRNASRGAVSFLAVEKAPPHVRLREALKRIRAGENELVLEAKGGGGENGAEEGKADRRLPVEVFLKELARYVRRLHDAGVWHRDFSGGNLLIPQGWRARPEALPEDRSSPSPDFILLDVNRCRFFPRGLPGLPRRLHDLERISLDPGRRESFFDYYAAGDTILEAGRDRYLKRAADYRRLRETRNPALRLWRKVFTYWLRFY